MRFMRRLRMRLKVRRRVGPMQVATSEASQVPTPGILARTESQRYRHYCRLLKECGFTGAQLVPINAALREAGLEVRKDLNSQGTTRFHSVVDGNRRKASNLTIDPMDS